MAVFERPGYHLHYRIDGMPGHKPWLTFCNSLGTDLHAWDRQIEDLFRHYCILRYDRRGHGLSSAPPPPYALSDLGADVIALLDTLGIQRTHLCGLSIGGLTAQWLGIHAGGRLDKIVVCATAAKIGTAESWNARIALVRENGLDHLTAATTERWFTPAFAMAEPAVVQDILKRFAATSIDGYIGCCSALATADLKGQLGQITNPVLAISGDDDSVCPLADLQAIADGVKHGQHVSLPGRHIVNVEAARAFNAAVLAFLASDNPDQVRA
ncbi:3-oxoadipate enol-lactonase [Agrobacterium vitis]|uniref:3-oxoadipate enol-lactonase n=1 Tax=Agrobacterium vitis TaxID=373 RepID=UPI001F3F1D15|nr:3-oxoadipate enol-lactonase [Agrobacterium vitis]MCF1469331.1 3-oxoadipate enol-lactonase [Agrobacterium vitis]